MIAPLKNERTRRTAQAFWTLIEPQPQEVKDYLVSIIWANRPEKISKKKLMAEIDPRLEALKSKFKPIPDEAFADDERAQYILSK